MSAVLSGADAVGISSGAAAFGVESPQRNAGGAASAFLQTADASRGNVPAAAPRSESERELLLRLLSLESSQAEQLASLREDVAQLRAASLLASATNRSAIVGGATSTIASRARAALLSAASVLAPQSATEEGSRLSAEDQPTCTGEAQRHCPNAPSAAKACKETCPALDELIRRNPSCAPQLVNSPVVFLTALSTYTLKWKLLCAVYTSVHLFFSDYRWPRGYGIREFGKEFAAEHTWDGKGVPFGMAPEQPEIWSSGIPDLVPSNDPLAAQRKREAYFRLAYGHGGGGGNKGRAVAQEEESGNALERTGRELERRRRGGGKGGVVRAAKRGGGGGGGSGKDNVTPLSKEAVIEGLQKLDKEHDGFVSREDAAMDPELLKLFNELDADGRGIVEIRALAHKVLEHRRYAALFTLPSAYAQSDPAGHPPWLEKQGLYWLDLYHPFTWAELWRGIPFFQCGIASRMMEYLLDHVLLYQLAHGVECYWFAGNTACASSRATAEFVGRETITTVGYGHLGPDRWGGDEGFCHKPSSRAEYLALRDARLAMLNIMFEWKMWKSEWADNID